MTVAFDKILKKDLSPHFLATRQLGHRREFLISFFSPFESRRIRPIAHSLLDVLVPRTY
jgi:hypothetical protein